MDPLDLGSLGRERVGDGTRIRTRPVEHGLDRETRLGFREGGQAVVDEGVRLEHGHSFARLPFPNSPTTGSLRRRRAGDERTPPVKRLLALILPLALTLTLGLGACSDDGDGSDADSDDDTTTLETDASDDGDAADDGGGSGGDGDNSGGDGGEIPNPCTLIPREDLAFLLDGPPGEGTGEATVPDQRKVCTYESGLILAVETAGNWDATLAAIRTFSPDVLQDVPGIGQAAVWQEIGDGSGQFLALSDDYFVGVTLPTGDQTVGQFIAEAMLEAL